MEMSGLLRAPAASPQGKTLWYPFDRRLGGPQSRSGQSGGEEKNSRACNPALNWLLSIIRENLNAVWTSMNYIPFLITEETVTNYIKVHVGKHGKYECGWYETKQGGYFFISRLSSSKKERTPPMKSLLSFSNVIISDRITFRNKMAAKRQLPPPPEYFPHILLSAM
jgi:hypothetical protein